MQALVWLVRFLIVVILVWFAVKNAQVITIHGLPEQSWQAPLVFILLVVFVAGVAIGLLAWVPTVVRQRREISRLRRTVETQAAIAGTAASADATAPVPALAVERLPQGTDAHGI